MIYYNLSKTNKAYVDLKYYSLELLLLLNLSDVLFNFLC